MNIEKHIIVQAVKTENNELIPVWDERIQFVETSMYGNVIKVKNDPNEYNKLVECIYDIEKKKLELGIEINYFPDINKLEFKIGEDILFEKSPKNLAQAKIADVIFENYYLHICRGADLDKWITNSIPDISNESLYAVKQWNPVYLLDNGVKIKYTHNLYHISR